MNREKIEMKNIKELIVISPCAGLEVGDVLTRNTPDELFHHKSETIDENGSIVRSISLSEGMINRESFKATAWFENKPLTNKQKINILAEDNIYLADKVNKLESENKDLIGRIIDLDNELDKISGRIYYKRNEFKERSTEIKDSLKDLVFDGEDLQRADEELTVLENMVDLLDKIVK